VTRGSSLPSGRGLPFFISTPRKLKGVRYDLRTSQTIRGLSLRAAHLSQSDLHISELLTEVSLLVCGREIA
jgi:hypothetical protein